MIGLGHISHVNMPLPLLVHDVTPRPFVVVLGIYTAWVYPSVRVHPAPASVCLGVCPLMPPVRMPIHRCAPYPLGTAVYTLGYYPLFVYTPGSTIVAPCLRPNPIVTAGVRMKLLKMDLKNHVMDSHLEFRGLRTHI